MKDRAGVDTPCRPLPQTSFVHMPRPKKAKPTYDVVYIRRTDLNEPDMGQARDWRTIGRAWREPDGKIIIKMGGSPFEPFDGTYTLFPWKPERYRADGYNDEAIPGEETLEP